MAFIGNQPTAVPLTSSQLVDGIITTDKLAADAVTSAKILDSTIVNADIASTTINLTQKVTGTLPFANGGTGLSTLGTAGQALIVNSSATALSYATVGVNTPAFLAYLSADQSISNGVQVKAQFNTEVFDVGGCYDNATNYRFTPNVAGKYMVFSNLLIQLNDYGIYNASIEPFFNGSQYTFGNNVFGTGANLSICMYVSHIISFNGTTDYVEIFGSMERHTSSGNRFDSGIKSSYFGAYKIIE